MYIANNINGEKVHISSASKSDKYYCPICGEELNKKWGYVKTSHFAHKSNSKCTDKWHYDMTQWHYEWQNQFPIENQEVVFECNGEKHRADVFINNTVIEFQHSNISKNEFEERNSFYSSLGYKIVWIFDVRDDFYNDKIYCVNDNLYEWIKPRTTFYGYNNDENIDIYLQCTDNTWEIEENYKDDLDFCDYSGDLINIKKSEESKGMQLFEMKEIVDDIDILKKYINIVKNVYSNQNKKRMIKDLADPIYIEMGEEETNDYYGYCPKYKKFINKGGCHDCIHLSSTNMECIYRFSNLLSQEIERIQDINYDNEGRITDIKLTLTIHYPDMPSTIDNIINIWESYKPYTVAIMINTKTGWQVKIHNPIEQVNKYKKCYGYFKGKNSNYFSKNSEEIYGWDKPIWVMKWYK